MTPLGGIFDYAGKKEQLIEVLRELEDPDVWNDPERAQSLGKERASLEAIVLTLEQLGEGLGDASDLLEMAVEEGDEDTVASVVSDLDEYEKQVADLEFVLTSPSEAREASKAWRKRADLALSDLGKSSGQVFHKVTPHAI